MLGEGFFYFPVRDWERVCRKQLSLVKLYQRFSDMKYISEFKYSFTNLGYLHCAILKALHSFQEKGAHKSKDMQFFLQNVPNEIFKIFKMLENNMKFTRAACYCWSLLWCNYWKSLKVGLSPSKNITLFASRKVL